MILLSRNTAETGLRDNELDRALRVRHHPRRLHRRREHFPLRTRVRRALFLSANGDDVRRALDAGHAAAQILPANFGQNVEQTDELRIAFDGDAVLFSDEAERVYKQAASTRSPQSEVEAAKEPLSGGPFKNFLAGAAPHPVGIPGRQAPTPHRARHGAQRARARARGADAPRLGHPHRRGAVPRRAGQGAVPKAFGADIFFDDQRGHVESARKYVTAGHVPFGIANE